MLRNLLTIRQFWLTKWGFLVHSTTRNVPYIHPSHDSILELWRTFPNVWQCDIYLSLKREGDITEAIFNSGNLIFKPTEIDLYI